MKCNRIIILLLLFAIILITTCSDSGNDKNVSGTTAAGSVESEPVETGLQRPDLPKETFGGYEFRFLSRGLSYENAHWKIIDTVSFEESAGDVINDAVLLRNQYIEETYDVKIVMVEEASYEAKARTTILANEDYFDVYNDSISTAGTLASQGYMVDLKTIPYLKLDKPWWDQNACTQLSIEKRLFMATNDMTLMDKSGTWVVLFTKDMITDFDLESPYEIVANNKWTLDKMREMAVAVSYDVDGDGVMADDDSWGIVGETWNANALMAGAGTLIFTKDADDLPVFSMANERVYGAFEKVFNLIGDKSISLFAGINVKNTYVDVYIDLFGSLMEKGQALFYVTGMNRVFLLRGQEADFGIIPNPKYNEAQDKFYQNMSYGNSNCVAVPMTNRDLTRTGILLEAITFEASITSFPAYIDTSVKTKYSRDEESVAMLDIIYTSRVFDLGHVFNWGSAAGIYSSIISTASPDIVSRVTSAEAATIAAMEKTIDLFNEVN
ncbi:MAG: hypothetical protein FWF15_04100 [Oscillospiraceae bacterium]|nr:hypothetical protein [Oscillospiraceae bacterium]